MRYGVRFVLLAVIINEKRSATIKCKRQCSSFVTFSGKNALMEQRQHVRCRLTVVVMLPNVAIRHRAANR
jgi:hypothetical protein